MISIVPARGNKMKVGLAATSTLLLSASPLRAMPLHDAFTTVLATNPSIRAARIEVEVQQAGVDIARAEYRPTLTLVVNANRYILTAIDPPRSHGEVGLGVDGELPIYTGRRASSAIALARARTDEAIAALRMRENELIADTATAHANLLRDSATLSLAQQRETMIDVTLRATRDRVAAGDANDTDIHQTEARRAAAQARIDAARGSLIASEEAYRQLVGEPPGTVADVRPPPVPAPSIAALAAIVAQSPSVAVADARLAAARAEVRQAAAERRPKLSFFSRYDYALEGTRSPTLSDTHRRNTFEVGVRFVVPLFQGGGLGARLGHARAREANAIEERTRVERDVVAEIRSQYAAMTAADERVQSLSRAVDANREALAGVTEAVRFGDSDVIDQLNAQEEVVAAETDLAAARRDRIALAYSILALMGHATDTIDVPVQTASTKIPGGRPIPGVMMLAGYEGWRLAPSPATGTKRQRAYGPPDIVMT